ncbi:4972_t:CDS:2, partial [Ambispora gerdemannii]
CKRYVEEPDYRVKKRCLNGHTPWPEDIYSNCQPSAVTLQQQFHIVDHIEFSTSNLINDFINFQRSTGYQRFGYLYERCESYPDVLLGIKAVVEAIYELSQETKRMDQVSVSHEMKKSQSTRELPLVDYSK